MTMSEPSAIWTSIETSGERNFFEPSMCERNVTPSSVILRRSPRLKTWNPPLSVRMAPSQCMNLCRPPASRMRSMPGRRKRWYVFDRMMPAPRSCSSSGETPLTDACVPTGMKIGVGKLPCGVWMMPARAPVRSSFLTSSYVIAVK